uniref:DNA-directed RNA polymerase n=1 Tax=viral metagenome TaxID=1070528 RepID=A0A6C0JS58_9ZZZZ
MDSNSIKEIKRVQFGIFSADEIRKKSVVEVKSYKINEDGKPKENGLLDPRQGVTERGKKCKTCNGIGYECIGHFGHIELGTKIINVQFIKQIIMYLRCVCFRCSKILKNTTDSDMLEILNSTKTRPKKRFTLIYELTMKKKVPKCKNVRGNNSDTESVRLCDFEQPSYKKLTNSTGHYIVIDYSKGKSETLSSERIYDIFVGISDKDCIILGMDPMFSRPERMILTVLPVPPPQVRPPVTSGATKSQDDLTFKLHDIVYSSNIIKETIVNEKKNENMIIEENKKLQYHVTTYFDNEIPNVTPATHKDGRLLVGIKKRLKGKDGRVRDNLMGKRVDFCARTVIGGDPNLEIYEIGVPQSIAKTLTFPEIVTPDNIDELKKLVLIGDSDYPGARYIIRDDESIIDLKKNKYNEIFLKNGYIVERHMKNGDLVVFNRQPTLHKMSMMGHKVRVLPWSTFRINLSVTTPYNADFDGDEMNLHFPQSLNTKSETKEIFMVSKNILTPQSNRPVMGIVQDALLGSKYITKRDTFIEKNDFMNLLLQIKDWNGKIPLPCILKPKTLWSGKQLFSIVIPGNVNIIRNNSEHPDKENTKEDELIIKKYILPGYSKIIKYNPTDIESKVIESRMIKEWLSEEDTKVIIRNGQLLCGTLCKKTLGPINSSLIHIVALDFDDNISSTFYSNIQKIVNNWLLIRGHTIGIEDIIVDYPTHKIISETIRKAKKEVLENIDQVKRGELLAAPGNTIEQTFENKVNLILNEARDKCGSNTQKSLSNNNNLKAMVTSGSKGSKINIAQIMACVGQQNVEGKRIAFGFKDRTLPFFDKNDYSPESKGFVENSYLTGLSPTEFFFHAMGGREGIIDTAVKTADSGYIQRRLIKSMETCMVRYDGTVRNSLNQIIQFIYGDDGLDGCFLEFQDLPTLKVSNLQFEFNFRFKNDKNCKELDEEWETLKVDRKVLRMFIFPNDVSHVVLPCNIERLIDDAKIKFPTSKNECPLEPLEIIREVKELSNRLIIDNGKEKISKLVQFNATLLINILIRSKLCCRQVIDIHKLNRNSFFQIIRNIQTKFFKSIVNPGEMVGPLAALSLGEPATQMTLNTFHYAGVSSKNVTLGIPRLKEIINVSKKLKTPSNTIYFVESIANNFDKVKEILYNIEKTTLHQIVSKHEYDDNKGENIILKLYLNSEIMNSRNIKMENVEKSIRNHLTEIFPFDVKVEGYTISLNLTKKEPMINDKAFLKNIKIQLNTLTVKGISEISKVYMYKPESDKRKICIDKNGEFKAIDDEYIFETDGLALKKILKVDGVDILRTTSNHVIEILNVFGVEACKKSLEIELDKVISFDGTYVNARHLNLLCNVMTFNGKIMSINRHGINKQEVGPLLKASFEETLDVLVDAATHSDCDKILGVSESIMLGKLARCGTGSFDLVMDNEKLKTPITRTEDKKTKKTLKLETIQEDEHFLEEPNTYDVKSKALGFNVKPERERSPSLNVKSEDDEETYNYVPSLIKSEE